MTVAVPAPPRITVGRTSHTATPPDWPVDQDHGPLLTDWYAAVPDGTTVWLKERVYRCDTPVHIIGRWRLRSVGGTLRLPTDGARAPKPSWLADTLWPRERAAWLVEGGGELRWDGCTVIGPGTGTPSVQRTEEQAAWHLRGVAGVAIMRASITGMLGDGIAIAPDEARIPCSDITVRSSTIARVGRNAVSVVDGAHILVEDVTVDTTGRSVINCEPAVASWVALHVKVAGMKVNKPGGVLFANLGAGNGTSDIDVSNVVVTNGRVLVTIEGQPASPGRRARYRFTNLRSSQTHGGAPPFRIAHVDDLTITDCSQPIAGRYGPSNYSGVGCELTDVVRHDVAPGQFPRGASAKKGWEAWPITEVVER